ncbi:MAG: ATP-NAD kinase [Proteobacteria bacterium]|nr:ATP-NAD kinase [Pseudomonadota bacterium]
MDAIGIVANPASGKDVRRLVARASVFDNREKCAIIRRALTGAINAGAREFIYLDDSHNITGGALAELEGDFNSTCIDSAGTNSALDTETGAEALSATGCLAVLILGGDGTSRAFIKGWRNANLLPLSTGTNNVFPRLSEATVAGAALGVLAAGGVSAEEVLEPVKIIDIEIEDEHPDIALIDAVVTSDRFIGSRALLDGTAIDRILLTRAEPMAVGMTSVGGLMRPLPESEDAGLHIQLGKGGRKRVHAPIAPGLYETLRIKKYETVGFDEPISFTGPCVLAFDGEREREVRKGQRVTMRVSRTGPSVLNIEKTMQLAASRGLFT